MNRIVRDVGTPSLAAAVVFAVVSAIGCGGSDSTVSFTDAEWAIVTSLSPLPEKPPPEPTNAYADSPDAARLGQMIFFDRRVAGPIVAAAGKNKDGSFNGGLGAKGETKKIACVDCHMPSSGWLFDIRSNNGNPDTPNATSIGADLGVRNVSSVIDTAYYLDKRGGHWRENDGFGDSAWGDARSEPEGPEIQNGSRLQLAHLIFDVYKSEYETSFPEWPLPALDDTARFPPTGAPGQASFDGMTAADQDAVNRVFANYGKSIEAYIRLLVSRDAPFDRFVAGEEKAIDASAQRGLKLFVGKAGCVGCHATPLFSDDAFHLIGMKVDTVRSPWSDPSETGRAWALPRALGSSFNVDGVYSDDRHTGRLDGVAPQPSDKGKWRTKALRHVAPTAPYMHTGQFKDLAEVVDFYDRGGDDDYVGAPRKEIAALGLSDGEKADLVAFLQTLTGEPVAAELTKDTHKP